MAHGASDDAFVDALIGEDLNASDAVLIWMSLEIHVVKRADDVPGVNVVGIVLGSAIKEAVGDKRGSAATAAASFRWTRRSS